MVIERFLTYLRAERRYSENTAINYERDLRRFFADTGIDEASFDPTLVTADDIRAWIVSLTESGLSPASVNRMTSALRSLFRWMRKTGQVATDPFLRIASQKLPSRLPGYIPEAKMDEVIALVESEADGEGDFQSRRNALIITLFYSTGIRLAELLDIRMSDFSDNFGELKVRGKGNKQRVVPLLEYTRGKVRDYIAVIKRENICESPDNFLFLNGKGERISRSEVQVIVKRELAKAGVQGKLSPHVLRHTFATHMLNDGADIREIQEMLGHSSLSATQVYTHNSISRLKEVYRGAHPRGRKKETEREQKSEEGKRVETKMTK